MPIFGGLALESMLEAADYNTKSNDFSANFVVFSQTPLLNIFNIFLQTMSANGNWKTITASQCQIGQMGAGLYDHPLVSDFFCA